MDAGLCSGNAICLSVISIAFASVVMIRLCLLRVSDRVIWIVLYFRGRGVREMKQTFRTYIQQLNRCLDMFASSACLPPRHLSPSALSMCCCVSSAAQAPPVAAPEESATEVAILSADCVAVSFRVFIRSKKFRCNYLACEYASDADTCSFVASV